ncbi:MAG: PQQ-binding-like beta-propeller repeat protein, partial [Pirellulaceae bacterium]|nr:PQQ-binding-like beta-propeller repeat protein [Pirellulaceae bacterium]
ILLIVAALTLLCGGGKRVRGAETAEEFAAAVYRATGVAGGLVVHLGCTDGSQTAALQLTPRFHVHALSRDPSAVNRTRGELLRRGVYGVVAADRLVGDQLPYIDNSVNLVVASADLGVSRAEIERVLCPHGVAYIKTADGWVKSIKPRSDSIDEWTHFLHDASGNAVAHDDVVGPPRRLQWIGSPRWSRHHDRMASMSALVSSGGRLFYIMDEGSRVSIQLPSRWTLIARDAFNGVVLWKRKIPKWHHHLWPLKSGPTQLARRLVAIDDRVYVTLGIDAPVTALDAATGETVATYEGTKGTEELIVANGVVVAMTNEGISELANYLPAKNVGDQGRVAQEWKWNEKDRKLVACDAKTGQTLWTRESGVAPLTVTSDGKRAVFHDGKKVVCVDLRTGDELWASEPADRRRVVTFNFGPKLVLYQDVVLFAGGDRTMKAFQIESGDLLWSAPHARGGYQSPEDLLVAGGLVWSAPTTRTADSGIFTGRDPHTGEVKKEFPPTVDTYWFHHRCYIAKATDKYLMPSRTGIEFVDLDKQKWDIHHWVRGGCLYGVMPCNGLLYAPPHNCACYPETKLFGFNALAPTGALPPREAPEAGRFEKGPAFAALKSSPAGLDDWPTYRGDVLRSGSTKTKLTTEPKVKWRNFLGGRISSAVSVNNAVYVAEIDKHSVVSLDATTGKMKWRYTTGGRVDSPPTIYRGAVLFGSTDGWVYCVRADDGKLAWRYRAAPLDRRLMSLEQLESVWPVHGSVLVQNDVAYIVAGRSNFLDGGLRMLQLNPLTGEKLKETIIDERDPDTGENLQSKIQTLQMPAGLPDILSSDGLYVYMRSQRFDLEGARHAIGPISGNTAQQGSAQRGEAAHLFSPTGFLDGDWFHRSYFVFGENFAGGHNGYYQAGKYAPGARIMVFDKKNVYGYGRKSQYLKWTTILEHQLFAADKMAPEAPAPGVGGAAGSMVRVARSPSLDPTGKPLTVEAWVRAERPEGVVVARGGPQSGYALAIRGGKPRFVLRIESNAYVVESKNRVVGRWAHLTGVIDSDKKMSLYVNGESVGSRQTPSLIVSDPKQAMEIGADDKGSVGSYRTPAVLTGVIDEVRVYDGALSAAEVKARFTDAGGKVEAPLALAFSFDDGKAQDQSGNGNHGELQSVTAAPGKVGKALRFAAKPGRSGGSFVKHHWDTDVSIYARAMLLAGDRLIVLGPPDIVDEEKTFVQLTEGDPQVQELLLKQEQALRGKDGGRLLIVSIADGKILSETKTTFLPVWDGMSAARGRLFVTTTNGELVCLE